MTKTTEQKIPITTFEEFFPVVDVAELSETDRFLKYVPETKEEKWLKDCILEAIKKHIPRFRVCNAVISEVNGEIVFKKEGRPAVGHHINWWLERLKYLFPRKKSRIGTDLQYAVLLGVVIKKLLKTRACKNVKAAWKAVCADSRNLKIVEPWGDLTSVCKIFKKHGTQDLFLTKGYRNIHNDRFNLVDIIKVFAFNGNFANAIPFFVMDE